MKTMFKNIINDESGQSMTEYALIIALIAIALIGIITTFGDEIKQSFENITGQISTVNTEIESGT